jgi:hypothetical protein
MDLIPPQNSNLQSVSLSLPEKISDRFQEAAQLDDLSEKEFAILAIQKGFLELQELGAFSSL